MLIPITCTCGRSIGDIYDAFDARRRKLIEEKFKKEDIKVTPDKLLDITGDDINVELNQIFVDYHIDMICCRRILLTSVNFYDLMNKTHLAGLPQY